MAETVAQALKWGLQKLTEKGIEEPRLDTEVLLGYVKNMTRMQLYLNMEAELSEEEREQFRLLIMRRDLREPVSYLTGTREFMSLEFKVSPSVLIPRPETELLVEKIIDLKPAVLIDVGTGSGAIALSVSRYSPNTKAMAIDISGEALAVARENAVRLGLEKRVAFFHGDLLNPIIGEEKPFAEVLAANLPYIPDEDIAGLPADVRDYEPILALDGGKQGVELYLRLLEQIPMVLKPGGTLFFEIGYDQGCILPEIIHKTGNFRGIQILRDLAGHDRIITAVMN